MTADLTGGLGDDREYVFAIRPDDPEMRESVNAWIWGSNDDAGMPRIGVESVAAHWDEPDVQVNLAYSDGRVFTLHAPGEAHDPIGENGRPTTLGGGPLSFELVEPFRHWRMHLDGLAHGWTAAEQATGKRPDEEPTVPVHAEIDIVSAVPPWQNGDLLPEAKRVLDEQDEGALMGGPRFEQLSRASGTLRIGGDEHPIDGGALRVRRQGVRRLGTFRGHAWQSALFPSGRGFGYIVYPPRDDGLPTYNEGYLFEGDGELIPAWIVDAPWLRTIRHRGEDVSVVIETAAGTTTIRGESLLSCFSVMGGIGPSAQPTPVLQQALARYTWDGESANGMMERSIPGNLLEP